MKQRIWIGLIAMTLFWTPCETRAQFAISSPLSWVQQLTKQIAESIRSTVDTAIKEKKKQLEEATSGETPGCDATISIIPLKAYEYGKKEMWREEGQVQATSNAEKLIQKLAPAQDDYDKAKKFVEENWFAQEKEVDGSKGVTITETGERKRERQAYVQAVSARTLADATQLRKLLAEDIDAINNSKLHPESGCHVVDDLSVQNTKLFALIQTQLVGTALQLEALEMTVARDMLKETTDTSDSKSTSQSDSSGLTGLFQ